MSALRHTGIELLQVLEVVVPSNTGTIIGPSKLLIMEDDTSAIPRQLAIRLYVREPLLNCVIKCLDGVFGPRAGVPAMGYNSEGVTVHAFSFGSGLAANGAVRDQMRRH